MQRLSVPLPRSKRRPYNRAREILVRDAVAANGRMAKPEQGGTVNDRDLWAASVAEFIGPFTLVIAGVGAIISTQNLG